MKRPHTARPAVSRLLAATLLSAVAIAGCSGDEEPAAVRETATSASPTASPEPTRTLKPVVGERTATTFPLGSGPLLGLGGRAEPDQAAIDAAVEQVADWLDGHLDGLQRDGSGAWGAMAADGLANARQRAPVTTELASPEHPVAAARYAMSVYHDGAPQYLTARVEVTHPDDSTSQVGLVFVIGEDGSPTLTMFGPEAVAEAQG